MTTGVNPPLLVDVAYEGLLDLIVRLQLAPGAPLQEDALAARLEVGRTPLREAVKRLEAERLVTIYPRRGTFVAEINLLDHGLISDVRRSLEGLAAERAAERATPPEREELDALARTLENSEGGRDEGMHLDVQVHRAIRRAAHNPYLEADLTRHYNLSLRIWYLFLDRLPAVDHTSEHVPMLRAIGAGDGATAREYAVAHVDHFERSVREVL